MRKTLVWGAVSSIGLLVASSAMGQGAAKKPATAAIAAAAGPKIKLDPKETNEALKSSDAMRIETALANIRTAGKDGGGKAYVGAIVARLQGGLIKDLVKKALDTLADLDDAGSAPGCDMYLAHRDPDVRASAVKCLGGSKGPIATKGLRNALADTDPRVHSLAATLLGGTKSADAVPDLVIALDKGVNEAAVSIGQLCDPKATCDTLLDRMKSKPFDVISSGLGQVLARKDVPDDYKKKVITAVRELASSKAREFLTEVKTAWPKDGSKAVLTALEQAIKDLEGAK
jgi:hypothetical protein